MLQFVLPAVILGIASAAGIMRLTRGMLLEVLRQDYVRTAWAKGLRERIVVLKHALKNALIPVLTVLGLQVAAVAGGAVIIEWIFGIPGMGQFLVDAIVQRDYPVIQGINLVIVTIIVMTNLTVDLVYAVLDPRIRYYSRIAERILRLGAAWRIPSRPSPFRRRCRGRGGCPRWPGRCCASAAANRSAPSGV